MPTPRIIDFGIEDIATRSDVYRMNDAQPFCAGAIPTQTVAVALLQLAWKKAAERKF